MSRDGGLRLYPPTLPCLLCGLFLFRIKFRVETEVNDTLDSVRRMGETRTKEWNSRGLVWMECFDIPLDEISDLSRQISTPPKSETGTGVS